MRYWVFDLDGTLVDSLTTHFNVLERVFIQFGLPFGPHEQQEIIKLSAKTLPIYFESKFTENSESALLLFRKLTAESVQSIQVFSGIENILKKLQSKNVGLALWTAREMETASEILNVTGLGQYFSMCVSGSCVAKGKPDPEGLQRIANHFSCQPSDMVVVGDFESDMLGAKAFGSMGIRVFWHSAIPIMTCTIADHQFSQVDELMEWIKTNFLIA
jgi:HAD superfamily hydrolase (TIGR01509 family)